MSDTSGGPIDRSCMCGGFRRAQLLEHVAKAARALLRSRKANAEAAANVLADALEALDAYEAR